MLPIDESKNYSPKVSVIIATYNREKYLKVAIASVLQQTYVNFELIIIDDGSTDNTLKLVKNFSDPRMNYIYQNNKGRSSARNRGISIAKGQYITFLDSDDLYLPTKLALQVNYMDNHPEVGMIYTSAYCIDEAGDFIRHKYKAKASGSIYKKIAFFVPVTITLPTVMIRREILTKIGGFDENMNRFEDTDMWRRISKITRIDAINSYTCKLRTHADNALVSQNPKKLVQSLHYYAQKILKEDNQESLLARHAGIGNFYYHYAHSMKSVPHWDNFVKELLECAFIYWPLTRIRIRIDNILIYIKNVLRGRS